MECSPFVNVIAGDECDTCIKKGLDCLWRGEVIKDKQEAILFDIGVKGGAYGVARVDQKICEGCTRQANSDGCVPESV